MLREGRIKIRADRTQVWMWELGERDRLSVVAREFAKEIHKLFGENTAFLEIIPRGSGITSRRITVDGVRMRFSRGFDIREFSRLRRLDVLAWPVTAELPITRIADPAPVDPDRIYDEDGNWIGVQVMKEMTREEFAARYPDWRDHDTHRD
jgi:hypothetical protein